jgi:hypothetical protein
MIFEQSNRLYYIINSRIFLFSDTPIIHHQSGASEDNEKIKRIFWPQFLLLSSLKLRAMLFEGSLYAKKALSGRIIPSAFF